MGKIKKLLEVKPIETGDEDYQYEQYLQQDANHSIFPDNWEYDDEYYKSSYLPTREEEDENFKQTLKQNGHTA